MLSDTSIKTDVVTTDLIQASWDIIDDATYSLLLTNTADGTTQPVEISNSQTNKHVFTGLTPGQTYAISLMSHLNGQNIDGGTVVETTCKYIVFDTDNCRIANYSIIKGTAADFTKR